MLTNIKNRGEDMSEKENLDISRVIGVIMENPALIEQISRLVRQEEPKEEEERQPPTESAPTAAAITEETAAIPRLNMGRNRAQLLGALKPYVSEERSKAIDSMISIADILDMMRTR